uniref:DNA topoisomerase type IIA domain-containing protein n=1 Tax=Ditylenchus dipsaci TaxID=166011 RepID=A0A915DNU4_9BILA
MLIMSALFLVLEWLNQVKGGLRRLNNINLLLPLVNVGSTARGKELASARYIFTQLNPVTKTLFGCYEKCACAFFMKRIKGLSRSGDCPIIQPSWSMVLKESTGWSTKVPSYNPRDIVEKHRRLIRGEPLQKMHFTGSIVQMDATRYVVSGEIGTLSDDSLEITELPVKTWTQTYKESVIEPLLKGTVKFIVKMSPEKLREMEREGLHKTFKLQTVINTTCMVLFDASGCLRRFTSPEEICEEFFTTRKKIYLDRKRWMEGMLKAQSDRLSEQARFILLKIENKIHIENKRKTHIIEQLVKHSFLPDPVKKWKDAQKKRELEMLCEANVDEEDEEQDETAAGAQQPDTGALDKRVSDYDYLDGYVEALDGRQGQAASREPLEGRRTAYSLSKSWSDLWEADLEEFMLHWTSRSKRSETILKRASAKQPLEDHEAGRACQQEETVYFGHGGEAESQRHQDSATLDAVAEKYKLKKPQEVRQNRKDEKAKSTTQEEEDAAAVDKPKVTRAPRKKKVESDATEGPRSKKMKKEADGSDSDFIDDIEDELEVVVPKLKNLTKKPVAKRESLDTFMEPVGIGLVEKRTIPSRATKTARVIIDDDSSESNVEENNDSDYIP